MEVKARGRPPCSYPLQRCCWVEDLSRSSLTPEIKVSELAPALQHSSTLALQHSSTSTLQHPSTLALQLAPALPLQVDFPSVLFQLLPAPGVVGCVRCLETRVTSRPFIILHNRVTLFHAIDQHMIKPDKHYHQQLMIQITVKSLLRNSSVLLAGST